jgi:hypothetical protein
MWADAPVRKSSWAASFKFVKVQRTPTRLNHGGQVSNLDWYGAQHGLGERVAGSVLLSSALLCSARVGEREGRTWEGRRWGGDL